MPVIDLGSVVGPQGEQGNTGPQGEQGIAGPSLISASTQTTLTGVLAGDGSTVGVRAVDATPTNNSTNLVSSGGVYTKITTDVANAYQRTVNPNLLDNWYFVGGGSQQGGGQFPINQREQTSYTGNAYGIDRWNGEVGYSIVTVSAGGVNVKTSSAGHNGGIVQNINNPTSLLGKEITASVLYDNTFLSSTITVPSSFSTRTFAATAPFQLGMTSGGAIYIRLKDSTTTGKTYKAVKIELGSEQTLCHNEGTDANPVWVMNEIPNYCDEFIKCQRYLYLLPRYQTTRATAIRSNHVYFSIPVPVPLAKQPSIANASYLTVQNLSGTTTESGFTFSITQYGGPYIQIDATKNGHTLTDAVLSFGSTTPGVFISAEL